MLCQLPEFVLAGFCLPCSFNFIVFHSSSDVCLGIGLDIGLQSLVGHSLIDVQSGMSIDLNTVELVEMGKILVGMEAGVGGFERTV